MLGQNEMKLLIAIFISIVLNLAITFIWQGRFIFDILILAACIWVAAPLFLFSVVFLAVAYYKAHTIMIHIGQIFVLASLVIASCTASLYFGGLLNEKNVKKAKAYCEQLVVRLDQERDQAGVYPTNLVGLITEAELPKILKGGHLYYHSQGTSFSFTFGDPGRMMNGWDFISTTRKWSRFD